MKNQKPDYIIRIVVGICVFVLAIWGFIEAYGTTKVMDFVFFSMFDAAKDNGKSLIQAVLIPIGGFIAITLLYVRTKAADTQAKIAFESHEFEKLQNYQDQLNRAIELIKISETRIEWVRGLAMVKSLAINKPHHFYSTNLQILQEIGRTFSVQEDVKSNHPKFYELQEFIADILATISDIYAAVTNDFPNSTFEKPYIKNFKILIDDKEKKHGFDDCFFENVAFDNCDFLGAVFTNCNFYQASFINCSNIIFQSSVLSGTYIDAAYMDNNKGFTFISCYVFEDDLPSPIFDEYQRKI